MMKRVTISLTSAVPREDKEPGSIMDRAAEVLRGGGIVAFPTDTVYGVGADPFNVASLEAIFAAKGGPDEKPLALLVASPDDVRRLTPELSDAALRLMERFWPGPLTLVLPASPGLPPRLLSGRATVGARMPDHPVALALLRAFGGPLAVTSANRSGEPDATTADAVEAALGGRIPLLLDGGETPGGSPSTVADLTVSPLRVLREGPIRREALEEILRQTPHL